MIILDLKYWKKYFYTSNKIVWLLYLFFLIPSMVSFAQEEDMPMNIGDTMKMNDMQMTSSFSLNLPMNRDGSGTSWQPDQTPLMMYMKMYRNTNFMFHGAIFPRFTSQEAKGKHGGTNFDAPNWIMFILQQKLSDKDLFSFHSMFSLDIITERRNGYPLLFQTGETYKNIPLTDRQHPHDLFSELAINYTHSFNKNMDINGYFGYPGEPAIGPTAFMHRLSAMNNPDAPLGHHWQDATHITFGVGTIGLRYKIIKAEGSIFTGREPNENRTDFDKPTFDSYSYRLIANPNSSFSLQFSQGFIKSPEALHPGLNIVRTTASINHAKVLKNERFIASSIIWGMNHISNEKNLSSVLLESNLKLAPIALYFRYEFVQKNADELQLLQFKENTSFNIQAITIGINRIFVTQFKTDVSIGLKGTINFPDKNLKNIYGKNPLGAEIYLRLAPAFLKD